MANTFKFGNGNWATKEDSVLAYNDENNNFKPLPFDFTRASTATYVDSDGLIKTSKQGEARIDYTDSSDGALLLEPSRSNLLPYSNDFTNAAYSKTRCTVTANQAISPDGTQNADLMTATDDDARLEDVVGSAGQSTSMSVYVKSATGSDVEGQIDFSGANIVTFTATNEWQRIETTLTTLTITPRFRLRIDNDGDSLYVFGSQVEYGSYATSYIPTNGSTVTRAAETCSNSGNSEVFNDSEGVLFAEIAALVSVDYYRSITISDGFTNNRVTIFYWNNGDIYLDVISGGTQQATTGQYAIDIETNHKVAILYKQNDFKFYIDGFLISSETSGSAPIGLDEISFKRADLYPFYGKTKEIGYYDTALTDLELETLTSYTSWVSMVNALNLNIIYNG